MQININNQTAFIYTGGRAFDAALPTIMFVHGAGAYHGAWQLQSRYFAHYGFNVLAVDLPGHAQSQGAPLTSIEAIGEWLIAILDELKIDQASLVGHSMGSLAALQAAGAHPQRVHKLVLLGTAFPMPVSEALLSAAKANDHSAINMLNVWSLSAAAQINANPAPGMWLSGVGLRVLERNAPDVIYTDLAACNAYQAGLEQAAKITCPTLVISGKADVMTPARAARGLADAIPNVKTKLIDSSGHTLMSEKPDQVLDVLIEFLR
ncbi:MAG: alpha/beta hydrolase [Burkholderiales bacterium]